MAFPPLQPGDIVADAHAARIIDGLRESVDERVDRVEIAERGDGAVTVGLVATWSPSFRHNSLLAPAWIVNSHLADQCL